jgi:hypothetical protein
MNRHDMTDPDGLFPNPHGEQSALDVTASAPPSQPEQSDTHAALDEPQHFTEATSFEVRDEFQALVERDLLGPWNGETEELPPRSIGPRDEYFVGALGPKPAAASSRQAGGDMPDTETGVESTADSGELPEVLSPQALGRIWASSMGLSCRVGLDTDVLSVTAGWGVYGKRESSDEDGKKRTVWAREPVAHTVELRLDGDSDIRVPLTADIVDEPGVLLAAAVRERGGKRTVEISLINAQRSPETNADTSWLFQAGLTVTALDGAAPVFHPIDDPLEDDQPVEEPEEAHLRLLYRNQLQYATGHNVAVHPTVTDPEKRRANKLETTWLPTYNVPATEAPTDSGLDGIVLSMDKLGSNDTDLDTLRSGLAPLADGYASWLDAREAEAADLPHNLRATAESAVFTARRACERIRAGITLLTDPNAAGHADALAAFRFANKAMAAQRRHTEIARKRADHVLGYTEAKDSVDAEGEKTASWRPFQLAFVLLNLPALTDVDNADRAADRSATVDLLFFPTGGGKTEAYLGLTAFTFAIRRLQGAVGTAEHQRDGSAGVAVLMRYTLRLLTAQQFQRAAALVCAAEVLRREEPGVWGDEPFRIGLWVGGAVSPNWFGDAAEQITDARNNANSDRTNVLQTLSCPWCGTTLRAHRDLHPDHALRRVLLYCPNAEGAYACPFSRPHSDEGLPILTVDEEIYRLAPSLVIATVDKLAQLPWKGYAGMLFGRVHERCPRHGFQHEDLGNKIKCGGKHNKKGKHPAVTSKAIVPLRPPDLIIQDELHLISGSLGTTVGLFEAAVDELCTWTTPSGRRTAPKIVASTATTKRAAEQVRGIFARGLEIFPPQVTDVADTFFSRQVPVTPKSPGRRYLGLCAHGVRLKSAEIRLAEILLLAGQTMFDTYGEAADPYMTMVGYFNATRELAGMRRYLDDDVTTRVRRHGTRKGISNRLRRPTDMLTIQELTSRISSGDISDVLKHLEIGFDPEIDTSARQTAITGNLRAVMAANKGKSRTSGSWQNPHPLAERYRLRARDEQNPVDAVLATSMLQVGVDVSRFGLMVVTGQPKNTAEYIQASSRVGRSATRPGLVVTLYNWTRPRDLAHYEDFEHYHATFYRQVEALSVTPYTRRALDRTTAATFIAAVRNAVETHSRNRDAHDVDLDGPAVQRITERLLDRAETVYDQRGRDYLAERIANLVDAWKTARTSTSRLGYERQRTSQTNLSPLLRSPAEGAWGTTTVARSMRETENEINLLVPAGDEFYAPVFGEPEWTFAPPSRADTGASDDEPSADATSGTGATE